MRRRQLKRLWARLKRLSEMRLKREALLMKLGAARANAPACCGEREPIQPPYTDSQQSALAPSGGIAFQILPVRRLAGLRGPAFVQ